MANLDVETEICYLARRDLYRTEKPFAVSFPIDEIEGAEPSNHVIDRRRRVIKNVRGITDSFSLDNCGFAFLKHHTALTREDFHSRESIEAQYYPEITAFIRSSFPEYTDLVFLDYEHRKRSPKYPSAPGVETEFAQPLSLAHLDFTTFGAALRIAQVLDGKHQDLAHRPFDILNIWRVLEGPNNDWPLALCDYRTVDSATDSVASDVLFQAAVGENELLHFNQSHQWYYLGDQHPHEIVLFRNATCGDSDKPRAWHAAFKNTNPGTEGLPCRESLEVRVAAFHPPNA